VGLVLPTQMCSSYSESDSEEEVEFKIDEPLKTETDVGCKVRTFFCPHNHTSHMYIHISHCYGYNHVTMQAIQQKVVIELKDNDEEKDGKAEEEEARIKKMGITPVSFQKPCNICINDIYITDDKSKRNFNEGSLWGDSHCPRECRRKANT
jgi:hypothetical protein